jgi:hypothetical protein
MDHRDIASHIRPLFERIEGFYGVLCDDIHELVEDLPDRVRIKFEVCSTCNGQGKHVNPSIDSHGLSSEDFDEDPDFREEYFSGRYDVPCYECKGERVVPTIDKEHNAPELVKRVQEWLADEWAYARERTHELEMGY